MKRKPLFPLFTLICLLPAVQARNWQWLASYACTGGTPLPVDTYFGAPGNGDC